MILFTETEENVLQAKFYKMEVTLHYRASEDLEPEWLYIGGSEWEYDPDDDDLQGIFVKHENDFYAVADVVRQAMPARKETIAERANELKMAQRLSSPEKTGRI